MKKLIVLLCLFLNGCISNHEKIPVVYYDCNMVTGIFKEQWWFEGDLFYAESNDPLFKGYVHVTKFIGKNRNNKNYDVKVKGGHYSVMFDEGMGSYLLVGYGGGKLGVIVSPSWLPSVENIVKELESKSK